MQIYRRSKGRRMEASRERSGNMLQGTLATGKTTRKMALVSNSTKTETSMKGSGSEINVMVKVHTGVTRMASSVVNIQVTGLMIRNMVEVLSSTKMVIVMTVIGWRACLKVRVE